MFDMKRGTGRPEDDQYNEEMENERFATSAGAPESRSQPAAPSARVREAAIVGPSIHIDGDLRGEEDLIIEGTVNGTVHLSEHSLTVGGNGKVRANVFAKSVFVDGTVEGDLYGAERVAIRKSGTVQGNIASPRISLDDGARFKGTVEMDQKAVESAFGQKRSPTAADGAGTSGQSKPAGSPAPDKAAPGKGAGEEAPKGPSLAGTQAPGQTTSKSFGGDKTSASGSKS